MSDSIDLNVDAAKVRFFPPAIPLIVVIAGYVLNRIWPISFGIETSTLIRYWVGAMLIIGAVGWLGFRSVLLFRRAGQSENPWKPTPKIETTGPFKLTRNPMYLQMVLVCVGIAIATANWWTLLLTPLCAWALQELAIKPEESYLEQKFGESYVDYKKKVRRWI